MLCQCAHRGNGGHDSSGRGWCDRGRLRGPVVTARVCASAAARQRAGCAPQAQSASANQQAVSMTNAGLEHGRVDGMRCVDCGTCPGRHDALRHAQDVYDDNKGKLEQILAELSKK